MTSALLPQYTPLIRLLSHPLCTVVRQIEIDHNLIEVANGMVYNIANMAFEPVDRSTIGIDNYIFFTARSYMPTLYILLAMHQVV